ncbi:MAG: insulinase family protein [Bacteroidia bacterium]|nr:insulinase family protein [Bacteroidia bacterium]
MERLNRNIAPDFKLIDKININTPFIFMLHDTIPVYVLNAGTEDVIRMEVVFNAGSKYSEIPLVAAFTNLMLNEGTISRTSKQLAEEFDYYGSYLHLNADRDFAEATLYTLGKHFNKTLDLFTDIILNPSFPDDELSVLIDNKRQRYQIDEQKVKTLSAKKFNEVIFGKDHAYGRNAELNHYDLIGSQQLKDFHNRLYHKNNCKVIISGKITDDVLKRLETNFKVNDNKDFDNSFITQSVFPSSDKKHYVEKPDAVQSSIRIGKLLINKHHEDYAGVQILNTILGGYFGSRLMSNLREDKGYTYGVGSAIASLKDAGYFTTVCEVGAESTNSAINEIYKEIYRLIDEPVETEELGRVKNYMLGEFVRMFDGPFAQSDALRSVIDFGLDQKYFENYLMVLKNISPDDLKKLAEKYFQPESMFEVVAGKM